MSVRAAWSSHGGMPMWRTSRKRRIRPTTGRREDMSHRSLWISVATAFFPAYALAAAGDIDISVGLMDVKADMDSPVLGVTAGDKVSPVINASYFVTDHFALNTAIGITRHEFFLGKTSLGKATMAPPHLMAQWHFLPNGMFRPYVGIGVHHTVFFDKKGPTFDMLERFKSDTGLVLQAGVSYAISDRYFVNLDYKKFYLETDVKFKGAATRVERLGLDPDVISVAFGMRF
jgi:outer membrane protein